MCLRKHILLSEAERFRNFQTSPAEREQGSAETRKVLWKCLRNGARHTCQTSGELSIPRRMVLICSLIEEGQHDATPRANGRASRQARQHARSLCVHGVLGHTILRPCSIQK